MGALKAAGGNSVARAPAATADGSPEVSGGGPPRESRARVSSRRLQRRRSILCAALALGLPWLAVVALSIAALRLAAPGLAGSLVLRGYNGERFLTPLRERIARLDAAETGSGEGAPAEGEGRARGSATEPGEPHVPGDDGSPAGSPQGVLLFGDSISWGARTTVGEHIAAAGVGAELIPITAAMLRPVHYVYLLDEALRARPAVALVEVNVVWLGTPVAVDVRWQNRLARMLRPERAARIAPALARELAGPFDPLLFRLEERLGLLFAPDGLRMAASDVLERSGRRLQRALGLQARPPKHKGFPLDWLGEAYARDYVATPNTGVLRELLRGFRGAGVPVVFFVPPINESELAAIGMPAPADLAERIERLRRAVGAQRDEWLDLHALVPPAEFRDVLGHLELAGQKRVATVLVDAALARLPTR